MLPDVWLWHVILSCDTFSALFPYVVSPNKKRKEKQRNINNNLAILPSYDTGPLAYLEPSTNSELFSLC